MYAQEKPQIIKLRQKHSSWSPMAHHSNKRLIHGTLKKQKKGGHELPSAPRGDLAAARPWSAYSLARKIDIPCHATPPTASLATPRPRPRSKSQVTRIPHAACDEGLVFIEPGGLDASKTD
jgi:hypothetical protein